MMSRGWTGGRFQTDQLSITNLAKLRRPTDARFLQLPLGPFPPSVEDDWKLVDTPHWSVTFLRRGRNHAAAFSPQALEIVSKTENGYVLIATLGKLATETHHL
ncbi:hypothetical protein [Bradyrhizobium nanningense]|uniref:hypothetical protein n=1 Tax=Bradyrhizobium nanningense TaxID=1325118 RepID=UPI0013E8F3F2|nr:hypothetical protein [Bradyrhizobium nanningense]